MLLCTLAETVPTGRVGAVGARLDGRQRDRSFGRSVSHGPRRLGRSVSRSVSVGSPIGWIRRGGSDGRLVGSVDRWISESVDGLVAVVDRSVERYLRDVERSLCRSIVQSVGRSVVRSVGRSVCLDCGEFEFSIHAKKYTSVKITFTAAHAQRPQWRRQSRTVLDRNV